MIPTSFDYVRASSLDEAIRLLGEREDAKLLAGGHSLIPMMKLRLAQPGTLVDIGRIAELSGIRDRGDRLEVGALTTHAQVAASAEVAASCRFLAEAAAQIADPQVRNKGTVGGNIAHADPASDLPAVLVAAGATVHLVGPEGTRDVAAGEFFVDLLTTDLGEREVVTAVSLAKQGPGTGSAYLKVENPASGYAVCGAAAVVSKGEDGACSYAGLAWNGVTATPLDGSAITAALVGSDLSAEAIAAAVAEHLSVEDAMEDVHASGEYRAALAQVYGRRALERARDRA